MRVSTGSITTSDEFQAEREEGKNRKKRNKTQSPTKRNQIGLTNTQAPTLNSQH